MRESRKVECLRPPLSSRPPVSVRILPELKQSGLVRAQFQPASGKTLLQFLRRTAGRRRRSQTPPRSHPRIALRSYLLAPCAAAVAARPVRPAHGEDTCSPISAIPRTPAGFPVRCSPAALLTSLRREATSSVRRANRRSPVRRSANRDICSLSAESKNPLMSASASYP